MTGPIPRLHAGRYVQPLREGGSLPAVVETDDGLFVVKFRGAGQGPKALVAELIVGRLAATLGLPVPELVLVEIPPPFGRSEPDPEIQEVLRRSHGLNVGIRYLDGAFNYDAAAAGNLVTDAVATRLVWLDAFVTNPDRTHRNPNLLIWNRQPWLIDHGAALYVHHDWPSLDEARLHTPFPLIRDHVLLARSGDLQATDAEAAELLTRDRLREAVEVVPDQLLHGDPGGPTPAAARERYVSYLAARIDGPRAFVSEAITARERLVQQPRRAFGARR